MSDEFNSVEDLAFSRSFRNWVLNKDATEKSFWENWIARNPEKADMVSYAKAVVYALHTNSTVLSADEIDEEVRKAVVRLKEAPRYIPMDGPDTRAGRWMGLILGRRKLAVLLALALGVGGYLFYRTSVHRDFLQEFRNDHKREAVRQEVSDAIDDHSFNLPDGSLVRLAKSGKLFFASEWGHSIARREVFLRGQAYFDIRKDPLVPFYVYTDQVVVKALGTSFIVRSVSVESTTTVTVVTGEVSVSRQEDQYAHPAANPATAGMIFLPNQEAVYDQETDRLYRMLAGMPEQLGERPDSFLVFRATPIREVFGRLKELYGIPIQYDEDMAGRCMVTATLRNESYFEKLTIICKAIGGSYEVIDGSIVVTMPGCK